MKGGLYLPMLSNIEKQAHIFPNIKHSLVSIGALYSSSCTLVFNIKEVTVVYKYNIILRGWRNHNNRLWHFPLSVENVRGRLGDNKITY